MTETSTTNPLDSQYWAFNTKIKAAYFFYEKIVQIYQPNKLEKDSIPDELFYYFDAVIFELHAALQILLQILSRKAGLNFDPHIVRNDERFKKSLSINNRTLFDWWEKINDSRECHVLDAMRQHISHRGESFLQADVSPDGVINLLSIPVRSKYTKKKGFYRAPSGNSIELLEELMQIINYLNQAFLHLVTI